MTGLYLDWLLFPFKALASFFYCLWGGLIEWWGTVVAQWRFLRTTHGYGEGCITLKEFLWKMDQEATMPEVGDTVTFWEELWGVVEACETWDDNTLRFSVQVTQVPTQKYLRPYQIDRVVKRDVV